MPRTSVPASRRAAPRRPRAAALPGGVSPARPQGRAQEIARAALRVIARAGAEAVTHRSVAAEAGVALGSTTYHFASRDDLMREAFRLHVSDVYAFLLEVAQELLRPTREALVDFLVEIARREAQEPRILVVEYELIVRAARDPQLAADFRAYEQTMASRLAEALERQGAPQPFDAARTLIAVVRGFELDSLTGGGIEADDLRRRLVPIVAALTASGSKPARARAAHARRTSANAPTRRPTKEKR